MNFRNALIAAALCSMAPGSTAWAQQTQEQQSTYQPSVGQQGKDVIWVPTPQALVDRMLELAELTTQDYLVDLGSGDGRTVITAARRGARAHGIEFNPDMVALSKRNAKMEGVADRATFARGDIFEANFSDASVVTLFLLPELNLRLRPKLLDMKPGTRVVSNSFDMAEWQPDDQVTATENCNQYCSAYKWIVPAKVHGTWQMDGRELVFNQKFQFVEGTLRQAGKETPIAEGRLEGAQIAFTAGNDRFIGEVNGNTMKGTLNGAGTWTATRSK